MANELTVEEGVARLEGRVDEHGRHFEQINYKLNELSQKFDNNFRWTIGIIITTWITIIATVVLKG
ncbi:MAG: hypothetical protein ACE5NG_17625 [bacterium]